MIDYLEIRNSDREIIGIIDTASSIIWHTSFFGVGDYEIYIQAKQQNIELLAASHYVTRIDDPEVGIIEKIEIANSLQDGRMLAASGRFAKSILDRRIIYNLNGNSHKPSVLRGKVEEAVRKLVSDQIISCTFDAKRNIGFIELGSIAGLPYIITDENGAAAEKQVSFDSLMTYSDSLLEEYGLSSMLALDKETLKLQYIIFEGVDRSVDNVQGNLPIIFSQEFDNLSETAYLFDTQEQKTAALIGGEGEGTARFFSFVGGNKQGLDRRELWIDASSVSKTYKDDDEVEQTYSDAEYKSMLDTQGKQTLAGLKSVESFSGKIDITNSQWKLNRDFAIGDIVTVRDDDLGKYVNVRVTEAIESQDENGYAVELVYI